MNIFNLFMKTSKQQITAHPEIKISEISHGSHGDNMGGLIGFDSINKEKGRAFINEIFSNLRNVNTALSTSDYELKDVAISDNDQLKLRVL